MGANPESNLLPNEIQLQQAGPELLGFCNGLSRQTIGHLIHEHPAVGAKLLVKLTQLLRNTSNQLVRLIQKKHSDWCSFNSGQRLYFTSHRFQSSAVMRKTSRTKGSNTK